MGRRLLLAMVAAVAVVAVGGIGFAAITSTITINASANAGTFNLFFSLDNGYSALTETPTGAAVCNSGGTDGITDSGALLTISASNLGPGDYCTISDLSVVNSGSLPGTVTEVLTPVSGDCSSTYYADAIGGGHSIGGYGQIEFTAQLGPYTGSVSGQTCSFTVAVTGTAS
jgi:hypothetical protein